MGGKNNQDPDAILPSWADELGTELENSPYAPNTWIFTQTSIVEECEEDTQDLDETLPSWWDGLSETLRPYAPASWVYVQSIDKETESSNDDPPIWWEALGETAKPYASASWAYFQKNELLLEFKAVAKFVLFDETEFDRESFGIRLDSGTFSVSSTIVYDEAEIGPDGQRGFFVNKIFAEVSVYDAKASQPGGITVIEGGSQEQYDEGLNLDKPPGTLLGKVSYEILGDTATITSWNHYNWQDDEPVRRAISALLNDLPDCVSTVLVADDPTAFWTSLGFIQETKGGFYLTLRK